MSTAAVSNQEINDLRRDFDRLKTDLRDIRADMRELGGDAVRTAKDAAAETRQRIDQGVKAVAAKGKESMEAIEHQVSVHPFASLAAALAVGMIIGFGLSRKG